MSIIGNTYLTLADMFKRQDPDSKVAAIIEIMSKSNPILDDAIAVEGNLPSDGDSTFGSANVLAQTGEIALAALKTGYVFALHVVPRGNERYLRLSYDVTGTAPTAGKITAGIVADHQTNGL